MYTATLSIDNVLDPTPVSLQTEMTARELIEAAFVQLQTDANSDPFTLTIAYYGYDHYEGVTTYLGYFIVSISQGANKFVSDGNNYWELEINGAVSVDGMDSVLVEPNTDEVVQHRYGRSPDDPPTPTHPNASNGAPIHLGMIGVPASPVL